MPREPKPPPQHISCPFDIVACSNEHAPYQFRGLTRNVTHRKEKIKVPLAVNVVRKALWAFNLTPIEVQVGSKIESFSTGLADYCLDGDEFGIQIERKSLEDLFGTLGGRRSKFEAEIKRLDRDCRCAYLLIEADLPQIMEYDGVEQESRFIPKVGPLDDLFDPPPSIKFDADGDLIPPAFSVDDSDDLDFTASISRSAISNLKKTHGVSSATVIGTWESWTMKYPRVQWVFASNRSMAETACFGLLESYWRKREDGFYGPPSPAKPCQFSLQSRPALS